MKERATNAEQQSQSWNADAHIGEVRLWDEQFMLRLQAHGKAEVYRGRHSELIPLHANRGMCHWVLAKPYILLPDVHVTVQPHHERDASGSIGTVAGTDWPGMRREIIGNAQAWYYPAEQAIVLWECFLTSRYRQAPKPAEDQNHVALWAGFERFLTTRFPSARQLVTTTDDPLWETDAYRQFLAGLGYKLLNHRAFAKHL